MNLLITGAWAGAEDNIERIKNMGHNVCFLQHEKEKLPCSFDWVEGVICNGLFLYHSIDRFKNLKYIQLTSVGYDRVPIHYINENHIELRNAKAVYSIPMAEYAVAGILDIYKNMQFFRRNQKLHRWEKQRSILELSDKIVCVIGCGDIGTECAKRLHAFGCNVIGVNRSYKENDSFTDMFGMDELEMVLKAADIIILTLALNNETRHFLDMNRLSMIKDGAVLVNIARGALIDEQALLEQIDRFAGVVLDVFEEEPLEQNNLLWEKQNVIITPHNSFVGENNKKRLAKVIMNNLEIKF